MIQEEEPLKQLGVELSSTKCVIALATGSAIEIMLSDSSAREIPNFIGFKDGERFIGEAGFLQSKSNFLNTITYFPRFLSCQGSKTQRDIEREHIHCKTKEINERLHFEIGELQENKPQYFRPEQITATFLSAVTKKFSELPICLSYPDYYTQFDLQKLHQATMISQLQTSALVSESEAIMYSYGYSKKDDFENRVVIFIDIGSSKTSAFIASFNRNNALKLSHVCERNMGGRDIDRMVSDFFWNKIQKEMQGLNQLQISKSRLRLLDGVGKLRQHLSSNSDAMLNIECLTSDFDLSEKVDRPLFNSIIMPFVEQLRYILEDLKEKTSQFGLEYNNSNVSIEVFGGITRIPIIQQTIQESFPLLKLQRTINSTDAIAKGCALKGVQRINGDYFVDTTVTHSIYVGWIVNNQISNFWNIKETQESLKTIFPKGQNQVLYQAGESMFCPKTIEIKISSFQFIEFTIFYHPLFPGYISAISIIISQQLQSNFRYYLPKVKIILIKQASYLIWIISHKLILYLPLHNMAQTVLKQLLLIEHQPLNHVIQSIEEVAQTDLEDFLNLELIMKKKDSEIRHVIVKLKKQVHSLQYEVEKYIHKVREEIQNQLTVLNEEEKIILMTELESFENSLVNGKVKDPQTILDLRQHIEVMMEPHYRMQRKANLNKRMF